MQDQAGFREGTGLWMIFQRIVDLSDFANNPVKRHVQQLKQQCQFLLYNLLGLPNISNFPPTKESYKVTKDSLLNFPRAGLLSKPK